MYKNELDNCIRNSNIPRAIMLYGECYYHTDRYLKTLTSMMYAETLSLYFDEYEYELAKAHLSQGSLFGDKNLLIIKSEKKIAKSELDTLVALVQKNSDNFFIYCYYGDINSSTSNSFDKKSGGEFVRFFNPSLAEAINIVRTEAREMGLNIDEQAIIELINIDQNDIALAVNELHKLKILDKDIGLKEINEHISSLSELRPDDLFALIIEKRDFTPTLRQLLDLGYEKSEIYTQFCNYFMELYLFNTSIKISGDVKPIEIIGYNPPKDVINRRKQLSMRINSKNYKKALTHLHEIELKMKSSGKPDAESLLYSSLIKFQSLI